MIEVKKQYGLRTQKKMRKKWRKTKRGSKLNEQIILHNIRTNEVQLQESDRVQRHHIEAHTYECVCVCAYIKIKLNGAQ